MFAFQAAADAPVLTTHINRPSSSNYTLFSYIPSVKIADKAV